MQSFRNKVHSHTQMHKIISALPLAHTHTYTKIALNDVLKQKFNYHKKKNKLIANNFW
jgi:hypothetical protein